MNRFWYVVVAGVFAVGCESATTPTPPPPPVSMPVIACPAPPATSSSFDGSPVAVTYAAPTVTGGEAPVTLSCTPSAGSNFPVGATTVTCTAQDARQQSSTCSFSVSVTKIPRLTATRFVAFGDSITEGFAHTCPGVPTLAFGDFLRDVQGIRPPPDSPISYPNKLRNMLIARYSGQTVTVINEGSGGEFIGDGADDLARVIMQDSPQVLLLQEGTNDMDGIGFGANPEVVMTTVVTTLRDMIRYARSRGVIVFVGTLTPQRAGACRGYAPAHIGPVNDRIRAMVSGEDARLADIYAAFGSTAATDLIGPDGLHPSEAGYQKIADTFFDLIRQRLEN